MQDQTEKPNVLLICVDHWPGHLLGAAGSAEIFAPTLDQLIDNGIHFRQAYSTTPTCIPARRALMTGMKSKSHGDRIFNQTLPMPEGVTTMAGAFDKAGYQTSCVGKLHVYPQRDRIGFGDALICEEGRHHLGLVKDDYEMYLTDKGKCGQEQTHGMGVNQYNVRPWHLDEELHTTYWTAKNTCRNIQRRNPHKPSFWYCSFVAPHPPITPPQCYLDMYDDVEVSEPVVGDWAQDYDNLPYAVKEQQNRLRIPSGPNGQKIARKGFNAQCTYIDHQIRLILGTLNEEKLLDNTIIMLVCDHGDMLGDHNLYAKSKMYETSMRIPMFLTLPERMKKTGIKNDNLVCLRDVMPTLLNLCDIEVPETVEGINLLSDETRDYLYGEHNEGLTATRMIRKGDYKLIYYSCGNVFQLFNVKEDYRECHNLYGQTQYDEMVGEMKKLMVSEMYGNDEEFIKDGELVGVPDREYDIKLTTNLAAQRGWRL